MWDSFWTGVRLSSPPPYVNDEGSSNNEISKAKNSTQNSILAIGGKTLVDEYTYNKNVLSYGALILLFTCYYSLSSIEQLFENNSFFENDNNVVFPSNPYDFKPNGLILNERIKIGEGPNGGVFKWDIPGTKITIFEWHEDYIYGSHYHALRPEWNNQHLDGKHYEPGKEVPEPWKSIFFR